jgi:hypothetical protein
MTTAGTPLLLWLRRQPNPAKIRIRLDNGEERIIEPAAKNKRGRWKVVEATIKAYPNVSAVEKLDKNDASLDAFTDFDGEEEDDSSRSFSKEMAAADERREAGLSRDRREIALVLDRYGDRLNEAFDRGAAAASVSQENLVNMVESLMAHWTMAITNLHNVSINLANALQGQEGQEPSSMTPQLLAQVIGMAAAKAMGPAATPPNGEPPKGKKS